GEIVNEYQEKKDLEEEFKGKKALLDQKNDSISKAFQLEVQDFQLKSARMNQKKAQEKYQELGQKQQLLQQQIQFSEQQFGQTFNVELDSVITKVKEFTKEYGKSNDYTFILGTSDATSSVIYGNEATDLTKIILDALNAEYNK
ncbi:MAG: OmpH family outer membrane protein, partial [Flavobacteriaceae bacterium]|nr:OmpH family outer membrane protein [Flavobacteriaceae bacterium]